MSEQTGSVDVFAAVRGLVEKANGIVARIKSATEDVSKRVHDLRKTSEDAKVVKFREYEEKVLAALEQATKDIDAYISETLLADVEPIDVDKAKAEYAQARKDASAGVEFLKTMGITLPDDFPTLQGLRGSGGGGGTGSKRPRLSMITVDGTEVKGSRPEKGKDGSPTGATITTHTFTDLAKFLKDESEVAVSAKDLQAYAFEAAGTDDLSTKPGEVINFTVTLGEGDKAHTYSVDVTPADPDAADSE